MFFVKNLVIILGLSGAIYFFSTQLYSEISAKLQDYAEDRYFNDMQKRVEESNKEAKIKEEVQTKESAEKQELYAELMKDSVCETTQKYTSDGFFQEYKVLPGDTLLSISQKQLNDSSRVEEIILLNKEAYPKLSMTSPYLSVGWNLKLPHKEYRQLILSAFPYSSLHAWKGVVSSYENNKLVVVFRGSTIRNGERDPYFYDEEFTVDNSVTLLNFASSETLEKGDCVVVGNDNSRIPYAISKEEK